jgi:PHD/YefM family antitoxin component YafN of YafNO toxin-antitoxin module
MSPVSELPAGDTHDVILRDGEVVAVVVPIAEYRQMREALAKQEEAGRRLGLTVIARL